MIILNIFFLAFLNGLNDMNETILDVKNLECDFLIEKNFFKENIYLKAINNISFEVRSGITLGIVGESGCGKSTLCRTILSLNKKKSGTISWFDKDINNYTSKELKDFRKKVQIIFQNPYESLNPRMTIGNIISEPLNIFQNNLARKDKIFKVIETMQKVDLSEILFNRFPHELSGGQCQRVGIARAIINNPKMLICDEPVSSLDLSVQSQILNLLNDLKNNLNLTMIFVSHDLSVVKNISDEVMVLKEGKMIEYGQVNNIFNSPQNIYTKELISSVPSPIPV